MAAYRLTRLISAIFLYLALSACATDGGLLFGGAPDGTSEERLLRIADTTREKGDTAASIALYRKVLEDHPRSSGAFAGLGRAYLTAGKLTGASAAFDGALKVDPESHSALLGYGITLDLQGRHAEAQAAYEKAALLSPKNLAARNNLALSLAFADALDEARVVMGHVTTDPNATARHRLNKAFILTLMGREDEARAVIAKDYAADMVEHTLGMFRPMTSLDGAARARALFNFDNAIK